MIGVKRFKFVPFMVCEKGVYYRPEVSDGVLTALVPLSIFEAERLALEQGHCYLPWAGKDWAMLHDRNDDGVCLPLSWAYVAPTCR